MPAPPVPLVSKSALASPVVRLTTCRRSAAMAPAGRAAVPSATQGYPAAGAAPTQPTPGGAAEASQAQAAQQQLQQQQHSTSNITSTRTCRRCKQQFDPATNGPLGCRYHTALWTGSEMSKALGFCRQSDAPEHQLRSVVGRTGLIRFWDCCGAESEDAPGCCSGPHVTYDDPDD